MTTDYDRNAEISRYTSIHGQQCTHKIPLRSNRIKSAVNYDTFNSGWRGTAMGTLGDKFDKNTKLLNRSVQKMFDRFSSKEDR